jgi:hypothetical protein
MPPMRAARIALASACLLAAGALVVGCGGSGSTDSTAGGGETAPSHPAPPASAFPATEGRSLGEVIETADSHSELLLAPWAQVFYPGPNRYPFGIFQHNAPQVLDAEVAIYMAKVPVPKPGASSKPGRKGKLAQAETKALDQPAIGPFPAKIESLGTKPAFRGLTTSEDPEASPVVYSTEIDFPSAGDWRMAAVIREGDETSATLVQSAEVGEYTKVPRVGERAPLIDTPTAQDVGGDLSKITTRIPPDDMNQVNYADALGKEPILLLFATPKFCQSRVCGPAVDVAEQVQQETGDKAAFIHMEIYNHNDPDAGVRPQVRAFNLPSEPWLYAINREGVISAAVEGPFGAKLMGEVVNKVVAE